MIYKRYCVDVNDDVASFTSKGDAMMQSLILVQHLYDIIGQAEQILVYQYV